MHNLRSFYKNKKVLITGHTGFKGSWLSIWLKHLGADVTGIALDPVSERDIFNLAHLSGKITDYRQDIRDLKKVKDIMAEVKPEVVFHLAAQALVLPGYEDPVKTFDINIMGTVNILEACRKTDSVKQIVIVTTDKVYENKEQISGYLETDSLGGHDPYSASKAAAEIVTQSYRLSFNQPLTHSVIQSVNQSIATARAGNVIGGGDWSEYRLVPDCIRSLEADQPIILRNPDAIRPWQFVLEPLYGYLLLASRLAEDPLKYSGAWNFGPGEYDLATVKELVINLIKSWGGGKWMEDKNKEKPYEAGILKLNINKSGEILGWNRKLNSEEAVEMTVAWYKNYLKRDTYKLCVEQIIEYSAKWNSQNKS